MSEAFIIAAVVILVVLFIIYCAAGTIVRYRRGVRTCPEVVPHCAFWVDLMYWIFCCGKSRSDQRYRDQRLTQLPDFSTSSTTNADGGEGGNSNTNDGFNMNAFTFGRPSAFRSRRMMNNNNNNSHMNNGDQNTTNSLNDTEMNGSDNRGGGDDNITTRHQRVLSSASNHSSSSSPHLHQQTHHSSHNKDFRNLQQSTTGSGLNTNVMNDDYDDDVDLDDHDSFKRRNGRLQTLTSTVSGAVVALTNNHSIVHSGLDQSDLDRLDDENEELLDDGGSTARMPM